VFCLYYFVETGLTCEIAEFRGPGVHHNFDDSDSGYDVDMDQKKSFGGNQRGRIILLGDDTEVLTDSDDTEMFDHSEEDKDLASQVHKGQATSQDEPKQEKTGSTQLKGVTNSFLTNSTEPTETKEDEKTSEK